ncbi:MAG TPA: ribonuclease H-like domain-containing protein [Vicinamibacterales bacterium]|nr:ribonuclease H-like domain-containing protein [Vicinamibacterales bacterium]
MDLTSRLRTIVRSGPRAAARELTYEPDSGGYDAPIEPARVAEILGGRALTTTFGSCLVIDRRYESDRQYGCLRVGECELEALDQLQLLDPALDAGRDARRAVFIDLETTGLSGGAGTVAFLVGCGYFDLGAFQVRQFLLTSYSGERALLMAVADFFEDADLLVSYNGKTFDVPVMETRWLFHRMEMPLGRVPHFDMLHPARRLWRSRTPAGAAGDDGGCRLSTLERALFGVRRVGDVPGFEIPSRFFRFLRSGDPRPLEPVLEHNRLDLVSLAAVTAQASMLARAGAGACRNEAEALALGRVFERAGFSARAESCYRRGAGARESEVAAEALYRLGLCLRRARRFVEAADCWERLASLTEPAAVRRRPGMRELRMFATEALAIHHEHRVRDLGLARELAMFALEESSDGRRTDGLRHRVARLDRKIQRQPALLPWPRTNTDRHAPPNNTDEHRR